VDRETAIDILKKELAECGEERRSVLDIAIRALENMGCGCGICLAHNNFKCPKMEKGMGKEQKI